MKPFQLFTFSVLCTFARSSTIVLPETPAAPKLPSKFEKTCSLQPLGHGKDDTDQILRTISECGRGGITTFAPGEYTVSRKMTWNLQSSVVNLHGFLNFKPDINYWLNSNNTYRVIFIQDQASWFVITGSDFEVNAFNTGGIQGNGQTWWNYYSNRTRLDGDGRPVSLSLYQVSRGLIKDFRIESPPFWCNAVVESSDVTYDGMLCNSTNTNPDLAGTNVVWNTDGIDTYRSNRVLMTNWDVSTGDDCLAIKGNSTNIHAKDITCRGGEGIAFGSLGQYVQFNDNVENVLIENVKILRQKDIIQPNMVHAIYFKSWDGSINGVPPVGGGGAGGLVTNVLARNFSVDNATMTVQLLQNYPGTVGDAPSKLLFQNLAFENFRGSSNDTLVDLECSSANPCRNIVFSKFNIEPPSNANSSGLYVCINVDSVTGLPVCG